MTILSVAPGRATAIPATMQAPVFVGEGQLEWREHPVRRPVKPDDVLVRLEACGICGTDLNILAVPPAHRAAPGIIIGHEGVGVVAEIGSGVAGLAVGDRVTIAPRLTCGRCAYCRRGLENQCTNYQTIGTTVDGAFAPYLLAPQRALFRIDSAVSRDDAVFFEPLSCAVGAARRTPIQAGDRVAIIGAGPMGLLFAQLYQALGAGLVIVADVSAYRLDFARRLGVERTVQVGQEALAEAVLAATGIGADVVVDAVGNQLAAAVSVARRGGQILLFGLRPHDQVPVNQYAITRHDLTVHGAFVGLHPFVPTLQLLESGRVRPSALITHRLPLSALLEGVALMRSQQAMKVIIEM
jgi:threonine dehydrogenase-like Zn-dependent dehydrogenase